MSTQVAVPDDEMDRYNAIRAQLRISGYQEIQHDNLRVGQRIRHRGEQYPEARDNGTGVVLAVMEKVGSSWARSYNTRDIEVVVLKDRPLIDGMSRLAQWANYHAAEVQP